MLSPFKLDQKGFSHHFLAPFIAIAAVVAVGAIVGLRISGASSDCGATISPLHSGTSACVGDAQQMVNGSLAYMYARSTSTASTLHGIINGWPIAKLGASDTFDVTSGFGNISRKYDDSITAGWVTDIQQRITSNNSEYCQYLKNPSCTTLKKNMQVNGFIDQGVTWYALCQVTDQINSSGWANTDKSTDYTGGKPNSKATNKTNMWYIRSYMRAGITAANNSGCSSIQQASSSGSGTSTSWVKPTSAPANVKTTANSTILDVGWEAVGTGGTSADKYEIQVAAAPTGGAIKDTITVGNVTSYYNIPISKVGATGKVEVRGGNPAGWGPWSTWTTFKAPITATPGGGGTGGGATTIACEANGSNVLVNNGPGKGNYKVQPVSTSTGTYYIQGNEYNDGATETLCYSDNPGFELSTSDLYVATDGAPAAYPSIFKGCHWGNCTPDSGLPVSVSKMTSTPGYVTTTDDNSINGAPGSWDDSYDIWFNPTACSSANKTGGCANQAGGLEMMIWLDHQNGEGNIQPAGSPGRQVTIDGIPFTVWSNGASNSGPDNGGSTVSYVANEAVPSFNNEDLGPFAADAAAHGYGQSGGMKDSWSLIDVEAGFEPWRGGQGLTLSNFNVKVK